MGSCGILACMTLNRYTPLAERIWSRVRQTETCWLWEGPVYRSGYGRIKVDGKQTRAHRAVWLMLFGPIPDGLHVLHSCDVKLCVRPDHLHLGTHQDNMRELNERMPYQRMGGVSSQTAARGEKHGTHTHPEKVTRGEAHHAAKLDAEKVRQIRELHAAGVDRNSLARAFGVTSVNIRHVVTRKSWAHIP